MVESGHLGRLSPIPARQVWPHEAADFTPWLLANADVLSDALGMDLELEAAEHPVGGFSLDLIGTDRTGGGRVIVENQLDVSDHNHLGQILTYAGGTDPTHIVWVAPAFREEHRAAMEWLNERTDSNTRFFAVQVDVVRIGDSEPAPLLTLVVRPNDWGKAVKASAHNGRRWTEQDLIAVLAEAGNPAVLSAVQTLLAEHRALGAGASFYWGDGARPSVTAVMQAGDRRIQPWSIYTSGTPVWALNLDWIHKGGQAVPADQVAALVDRLSALPGVAERCADAARSGWRRRPSIPAGPLFARADSVTVITAAMADLYAAL